jgi:putative FmdB family regulatory protein
MSNYTYRCCDCGEKTVHNVPMDERDTRTDLECEVCRGTNLKRMLDAPNKTVNGTRKGAYNSNADGIKWNGR